MKNSIYVHKILYRRMIMKFSEIIMRDIEKTRGIKFEKEIDIENLSDKELRSTRFVDGWSEEEEERIKKEWDKRGL